MDFGHSSYRTSSRRQRSGIKSYRNGTKRARFQNWQCTCAKPPHTPHPSPQRALFAPDPARVSSARAWHSTSPHYLVQRAILRTRTTHLSQRHKKSVDPRISIGHHSHEMQHQATHLFKRHKKSANPRLSVDRRLTVARSTISRTCTSFTYIFDSESEAQHRSPIDSRAKRSIPNMRFVYIHICSSTTRSLQILGAQHVSMYMYLQTVYIQSQ